MIAGLFAVDESGGIGFNGSIPWPRNKDDMVWFKNTTQNQVVAMGRRTWESSDMPSPLPGRTNVLFTNNFMEDLEVEQIRGDACEALKSVQKVHKGQNVYVIGGADLLKQARPVLEKVYITRIPGHFLCDTFINLDEYLTGFKLVNKLNLGSCIVEEYVNEAVSQRPKARSRKRASEN